MKCPTCRRGFVNIVQNGELEHDICPDCGGTGTARLHDATEIGTNKPLKVRTETISVPRTIIHCPRGCGACNYYGKNRDIVYYTCPSCGMSFKMKKEKP